MFKIQIISKLGSGEPNNCKFIKEFDGTSTPVFAQNHNEAKVFPYSEYDKVIKLNNNFNNNGNNNYFVIHQ
jgi:hypothetical protein